MNFATRIALTIVALLVFADFSMAQTAGAAVPKYTGIGAGLGMGLAIIGAGIGIGSVGFAALSGIARQPEQAGTIRGAMILLAALVEGAALIAVVLCLVLAILA